MSQGKPFHPRRPQRPGRGRGDAASPPGHTHWDHVASWYDKLVGDEGSDYQRHVVLPAALALLDVQKGQRVLDLCCGQGVLARALIERGAGFVLGVDASGKLIAAAKSRGPAGAALKYVVGDARDLGALADGRFDAAACLMAVHDFDPIAPALAEMARALRPGGVAVLVFMHPCFRIPRQSSWGWDEERKVQYRRLDRYASPLAIPIATHPGSDPGQHTVFFHRPLGEYFAALSAAGLAVTACQELFSHKQSEPGGRSRGENRARQEFPIFLAIKAVK